MAISSGRVGVLRSGPERINPLSPEFVYQVALNNVRRLVSCAQYRLVEFDFQRELARVVAVHASGGTRLAAGKETPLDAWPGIETLRQGAPHRVNDLDAIARLTEWDQALRAEGVRSYLNLPLIIEEHLVGCLQLASKKAGLFSAETMVLSREGLDLIALAIQLAHRYEIAQQHAAELERNVAARTLKLEQQFRRQSALAEIELAINEPHELQIVLDRIAEVTTELLPASGGVNVILWEAETESYFVGSSTVPGQLAQSPAKRIRRQGGATRWIIENRQALVVPDASEDSFGGARMMTIYLNRAYVGVPLMVGSEVLGVLYAFDKEPREYTQEDLNFLFAVANRASAAISKVRLFESERKQRKLAETLRAANLALTKTLDLDRVLESLLIHLEQLVPYDGANVMLVQHGGQVVIRAARGYEGFLDPDELRKIKFDANRNRAFRTIMTTQMGLLIEDTERVPDWEPLVGSDLVRNWMGIPIIAAGKIIGFYSIDKFVPGFFTEEHMRSAEALAVQGAIAIQNAQLFGDVQRLAITDPLTGINNRRYFYTLAEREFSRASRFRRPVSAIMVDVDHFKKVNDTYGHAIGDQVLRTLADRMRKNVRDIDILGRYGGEEFVILLPETEAEAAYMVAERLRECISDSFIETQRGSISMTISLGVAQSNGEHEDLDAFIDRADAAMYLAKQAGGNCVKVFQGLSKN